MDSSFFSFGDFADMVRRRLWVILTVTVLGCVASIAFALSRTHVYQSSEVIQVVQARIDSELAPTTVGGSSARRLQSIQQRLMTRSTILEIVEKYELFADLPELKPSEKVALLRQSVEIHGVAAVREGFADDGTVSVLTFTATLGSAQQAQQVAHEFATRTIELSARSRIVQARETLGFFTEEEEKLAAELVVLDHELTAYRLDNVKSIPGSLEFRQSQFTAISESLLQIDLDLVALQRELAQLDGNQRATTVERRSREIEVHIKSLADQRRLLEARAEGMNTAVETSPQIERALAGFERHRLELQSELNVIATRRAEAEVGFKLEEQLQAEQLAVIEPAVVPDYPITPSRKKLAVVGGIASLILGFIAAFLLDLRRPVIRTATQMKKQIGFDPVVTIPFMQTKPRR